MNLSEYSTTDLLFELQQFQSQSENNFCADCKTPDPRWASYNLGCFLCLRCSGIHRSLGTHISKVKSIDLDTWTVDQVQSMLDRGNTIANSYWEASLPDDFAPPTSNLDAWIRSKYVNKEYLNRNEISFNSNSPKFNSPSPTNDFQSSNRGSNDRIIRLKSGELFDITKLRGWEAFSIAQE